MNYYGVRRTGDTGGKTEPNFDQETIHCDKSDLVIQGDQKFVPPLPGQYEKSSGKTEYGIFKYNLFKYYLEIFVKSVQN